MGGTRRQRQHLEARRGHDGDRKRRRECLGGRHPDADPREQTGPDVDADGRQSAELDPGEAAEAVDRPVQRLDVAPAGMNGQVGHGTRGAGERHRDLVGGGLDGEERHRAATADTTGSRPARLSCSTAGARRSDQVVSPGSSATTRSSSLGPSSIFTTSAPSPSNGATASPHSTIARAPSSSSSSRPRSRELAEVPEPPGVEVDERRRLAAVGGHQRERRAR